MAEAKNTDDQFVTFQNSRGEVISNDPLYKAKQMIDAHNAANAQSGVGQSTGAQRPTDEDDFIPDRYDELDGKALVTEAKERGVEFPKGTKLKVGELRELLRAKDEADEANTDGDDDNDSNDD